MSNYNNEKKSSDENFVIETFNLTKKYHIKGSKKEMLALNKINLKIKEGDIFGLLGANGAGKTTLVSILTTLIQPTGGYAMILGRNILKHQNHIKMNVGLMLGSDMVYHRLTGYRNLKFFCKLYNIKDYDNRIKKIAEKLNLTDWLNQYVENYSSGMKTKLAIARVLLIDPKILFLDEPMLGLDPTMVKNITSILLNLNKTIFLTSHQMNVVQTICNKIAFLKEGEIIKIDTTENFKKKFGDKIKISINIQKNQSEFIDKLNTLNFITDVEKIEDNVLFFLKNNTNYSNLFEILKDYHIIKFQEIEPNLDDVFIKLSS